MVLMNRKIYSKCRGMIIDKGREVLQISDHNLVSVELDVRRGRNHSYKKKWIREEYYRKGEDYLKVFGDEVE